MPYEDGFLQIIQLGEAWNQNMDQQFFPSWINVLDEYMMEWFKKWAPGCMCVGRKTHPFGNERHTSCCALASILWRAQIVEGKDRPNELGGKNWGRLLASCYECVSQYFQLVSVLCLTVSFVCQRVSQPYWSLVSTLLRSSRSENNGPRVHQEIPLTNTFLKRILLMWICWRP